jgi:hypothetical protein
VIKFHVIYESDRWTAACDSPEGQFDLGEFATPGAATEALHRWASGRGHAMCSFSVELRPLAISDARPPSKRR